MTSDDWLASAPTIIRRGVLTLLRPLRNIALILLLAGCGDTSEAGTDQDPQSSNVAAAPEAPPPEPPPQTSIPGGVVAEETLDDALKVEATLAEFRIGLSQDSVEEGNIAITIRNEGERPHTIEVRGEQGERWRSTPIAPGSAITLSMPLTRGTYTLTSADPAYAERGMQATLVVR